VAKSRNPQNRRTAIGSMSSKPTSPAASRAGTRQQRLKPPLSGKANKLSQSTRRTVNARHQLAQTLSVVGTEKKCRNRLIGIKRVTPRVCRHRCKGIADHVHGFLVQIPVKWIRNR